jgi:hypothetical protein
LLVVIQAQFSPQSTPATVTLQANCIARHFVGGSVCIAQPPECPGTIAPLAGRISSVGGVASRLFPASSEVAELRSSAGRDLILLVFR